MANKNPRKGMTFEEQYGKDKAKETKAKISKNNARIWKNKTFSQKHRKNISLALKGQKSTKKGKTFEEFYGIKRTKEIKKKISESKKGKNIGKNNNFYGKHHTKETIKKIIETKKRLYAEGKLKSHRKGINYEQEYGKKKADEIKEKLRQAQIKNPSRYWLGKKRPEETMQKVFRNSRHKPNKLEKKYIKFFKEHNLPYTYVGDGSCFIAGRVPDFINTNGEKILIEVFSDYYKIKYHESVQNYIKKRSQHFAKYGYKTIFIEDNNNKKSEEDILKIMENV